MKYYKNIENRGYGSGVILNKIYSEEDTPKGCGYSVGRYVKGFPTQWKLSTKAAYNKQEGIVTKPRVNRELKAGDKVIVVKESNASKGNNDNNGAYKKGQILTIMGISKSCTTKSGKWLDITDRECICPSLVKLYKLSTQTKLKQTEMENYSIEGSKALKTAFVEECGLKLFTGAKIDDDRLLTSVYVSKGTIQTTSKIRKEPQHFVLPKDWDAAVKYVTEFNTPKEVFKVGDWVVVLPEDEFYYNCDKENAQQITSIDSSSDRTPYSINFPDGGTNSYKKVRKATTAEIKVATIARENLYKMAGYVSKIDKSAKTISFGCQTYTKKEVKLLLDASELCARVGYNAKVKGSGFVVNETDILTPANLTKILEQLK